MELLILFILIINMIGILYAYHLHQNNKKVIGGNISAAKTFWLGYAMFHYFVLPWWLLAYFTENEIQTFVVYVILAIFYFRMLLQTVLMFVTHNWSPVIGILYNIIASFVLSLLVIYLIQTEKGIFYSYVLIIYILKLIIILLTDTYYARAFHVLVGQDTKGKSAIWFASDDEKFRRINRITARNNVIFIALSFVLLLFLLIYAVL